MKPILIVGNNIQKICDKINELSGKGETILVMTEKKRDEFDCELNNVFFAPLTKVTDFDEEWNRVFYFSYHNKVKAGSHYMQGMIEYSNLIKI
jgi:phosphoribosyl-ATP pyrophosphohydrolase